MDQDGILERLERLERESRRFKRSARMTKIALAVMAGFVAVASVPVAHSLGFPLPIAATEFDLIAPGTAKIAAKLAMYRNGPNLIFYDNRGKTVEEVGFANDANLTAAGVSVFDGNALLPGTGVIRTGFGYTVNPSNMAGQGVTTYDASGKARSLIGQTLNGSASFAEALDSNGNLRAGFDFDPVNNFTGFFSENANGDNRTFVGQNTDDTNSFMGLKFANGDLAMQAFSPPSISGPNAPSVVTFDATGAFRSVMGIEFFGTFDASETETGHLP